MLPGIRKQLEELAIKLGNLLDESDDDVLDVSDDEMDLSDEIDEPNEERDPPVSR